MNQILFINKKKELHILFKIIFWIFLLLSIIFIIYFIFLKYSSIKKISISNNLRSSYQIQSLYNNISNNTQINKSNTFVLGLIEIPKINLTYPILSNTSEENLEISPCHFYGPNPNIIGNMCIAGHNYSNNTMFGKLFLLDLDDIINIYDLSGNKKTYVIYSKFDIDSNNISCLSQDTNGKCEITLVTCSSLNDKRYIIKAKENRY